MVQIKLTLVGLCWFVVLAAYDFENVKTLAITTETDEFGFSSPALIDLDDDGSKDLWLGTMEGPDAFSVEGKVRVYPMSGKTNNLPVYNNGFTYLEADGRTLITNAST